MGFLDMMDGALGFLSAAADGYGAYALLSNPDELIEAMEACDIEELCNYINDTSETITAVALTGAAWVELNDRCGKMDTSEVYSYFCEYSQYAVKAAAEVFAEELCSHVRQLKNGMLLNLRETAFDLTEDFEDTWGSLWSAAGEELERRGVI